MGPHGLRVAAIGLAVASFLPGCESTSTGAKGPPPVTAAMVQSGAAQHLDAAALNAGRSLFLARCTQCHTLPNVAAHSANEWPRLVASMSKRAGLQAEQGQAVLAYVLAARMQ